MPSGGSNPIGLIDELQERGGIYKNSSIDWFCESLKNAKLHGMEYEWLDWFLGGIKQGMSVKEACNAATFEWDL
jgi:hypothetical protein